jgi:hypothetical protein
MYTTIHDLGLVPTRDAAGGGPGGLRRVSVIYRIDESKHAVVVQDIQHRSIVYRRR